MKKRILSILMALTLCLTLLPTAALAWDPPSTNISYTYSPGNDATGMTELANTLTESDGWTITTDDNGQKTYTITISDIHNTTLKVLAELYTREGYEQTKWTYYYKAGLSYCAFGASYFSPDMPVRFTPYWTKTDVSTADELETAIEEGATKIKLIGDITIPDTLTITGAVMLDLNGYVLKMAENSIGSVLKIESGGILTLMDSNPDAVHKFAVNDNGLWVLDETNGTKTVTGGVITGSNANSGGVYLSSNTTLNADGGTINGTVYNNGIITRSDNATDCTTFNGAVSGDGDIDAVACPYYTVTFDLNGGDGTAPAEQKILKEQTAAKPTDPTREGYVFAGWSQYDWPGAENLDEDLEYKFDFDTQITENLTLKALWQRPLSECTVTVNTLPYTGGAQTPSVTIRDGDTTLTEGGLKDYVFVTDGNSVTSATEPGTYQLTIRGVWAYCGTVYVEWTIAEPVSSGSSSAPTYTVNVSNTKRNAFTDVTADQYYYDAVLWAVKNGITGGVDETHFGPDLSCTRAQLVTFLWRAANCPEPKAMNSFTDVVADAYYAKAVAWAAENGIVDGYGNGLFGSEDTITREQMAVILYRFAKATGMDITQGGMAVREYSDFERISDYAVSAMQWAVNAGILQGYDSKLMPQHPCTRAQIVTMLYRLLGE